MWTLAEPLEGGQGDKDIEPRHSHLAGLSESMSGSSYTASISPGNVPHFLCHRTSWQAHTHTLVVIHSFLILVLDQSLQIVS